MALVDSLFSFNLLDIDSEELEAVCFIQKIIKNAIEKQEWSKQKKKIDIRLVIAV